MAPEKRLAEEAIRPNKRARQREIKRAVHEIQVQHAVQGEDAAVKDAGDSTSTTVIRLPTQLNVEERLATLRYETQSLLKAIRTSSKGSSVRAWQMLPRDKRRRNASHNLLALPKRLRSKGRAELRASNTIARSRSQMRRRRGKGDRAALGAYPRRKDGNRREQLIARAMNAAAQGRAWLETHLWHAKRFRMSSREPKVVAGKPVVAIQRWGFDLPEESSTKSFRSSWRDAKNAVTIADRGYDAWLRISSTVRKGESIEYARTALANVIRRAGLLAGWQDELRNGRRFCDTLLAGVVREGERKDEEVQLWRGMAPVQVIWAARDDEADKRSRCELLLRTHPSCVAQLERAVRKAILPALKDLHEVHARVDIARLNNVAHPLITAGSGAIGRRHGDRDRRKKEKTTAAAAVFEQALRRAWHRQQAYNVFELEGPSSGPLLAKVLVAVNAEDPQGLADTLRKGTVGYGDVIHANVHDPRLSFPPRARKLKQTKADDNDKRSTTGKASLLLDGALLPTYSGGEIQSRRAGLPVPGARLLPTSKDDIVPVVLLCRGKDAWTLLLPRGWAKAFWLSLVHPGTRVLGQEQLHVLRFDKRLSTFPYDWPGTRAFDMVDEHESQREFDRWQRTPPAKRVNFDRTGSRWPFGGKGMWHEIVQNGFSASTGRAERPLSRPPWLFALTDAKQLDPLVEMVKAVPEQVDVDADDLPAQVACLRSALLCVSLVACRKGAFERWDEVHMLTIDEQRRWTEALEAVQISRHERKGIQELENGDVRRSSQSHIGSITTAHFNLSKGTGSAIGAVSMLAYLRIAGRSLAATKTDPREGRTCRNPIDKTNLVLISSTSGGPARAASMKAVSLP